MCHEEPESAGKLHAKEVTSQHRNGSRDGLIFSIGQSSPGPCSSRLQPQSSRYWREKDYSRVDLMFGRIWNYFVVFPRVPEIWLLHESEFDRTSGHSIICPQTLLFEAYRYPVGKWLVSYRLHLPSTLCWKRATTPKQALLDLQWLGYSTYLSCSQIDSEEPGEMAEWHLSFSSC